MPPKWWWMARGRMGEKWKKNVLAGSLTAHSRA
jgi:hypothetical protein